MALALLSPAAHRLPRALSSQPLARASTASSTSSIAFSFFSPCSPPASGSCSLQRASSAGGGASAGESDTSGATSLDADVLRRVSGTADAGEALDIVAESAGGTGALDASDCNAIVAAALDRGNVELALSVFEAMRSGFARAGAWRWARPDVRTYALLVQRLAAGLRVYDALRIIDYVSRAGVSSSEEVPFGMIVRCPSCMVAVAVAQPQHGTQIVSCSKCRYQYELFSGDIMSIESEEISMDISALDKLMRFINVMKDGLPAAVHSIVIRTPSGTARTHRFATETVQLPAQEGERVTISLAAPSNVYRAMGPLKIAARSQGFRPGEPLSLTNHISRQVSRLLRAPSKNEGPLVLNPYLLLVGALALLASGDAASAFIDPSLPRLITATAFASAAVGTTLNQVILPEIRKLPQKTVDIVAVRQQLLSQYDMLQTRLKDLKQLTEKEVWMLARMCQLENKILAVGEPSYRARRGRVKRVRESLESTLLAKIELMESYAKLCSMIEIEVEMDSDVIVAEAASSVERISEQIQQLMEIDSLEEQWRIQAEANDEAERLLSSDSPETFSAERV
ncbi:hypothetical protein ABZP36_024537 [Zizania latifolia]